MAFQGSLAELHLPDIIQLVSVSGKTGVFHLTDGGAPRARSTCRTGQIVHAELEDLEGEEAVYALAIWRKGEFRFDAGVAAAAPDDPEEQHEPADGGRAATRRVAGARRRRSPRSSWSPEFVVLENREGQINLNTMEWLLLSKIDGQRSVRAIAAAAGLSVFDAAKLLYGLVATGLIRLKEQARRRSPPTRPPLPVRARPPLPRPARPAARPATPAAGTPPPPPAHPLARRPRRVRGAPRAGRRERGPEALPAGAGARSSAEPARRRSRSAIQQIARAAGILKGSAVAEAVLQLGPRGLRLQVSTARRAQRAREALALATVPTRRTVASSPRQRSSTTSQRYSSAT